MCGGLEKKRVIQYSKLNSLSHMINERFYNIEIRNLCYIFYTPVSCGGFDVCLQLITDES